MSPDEPFTRCADLDGLVGLNDDQPFAAAQIAALAAHLAACPICHHAEQDLTLLLCAYGQAELPPLSTELEDRLMNCLCRTIDERSPAMTDSTPTYSFGTTLDQPMDAAIEAVTAALKTEGFGILTRIDVADTLKQKLDVDFEPYVILGACNPHLAHQALTAVHDIGLLLPCNVVVHTHGGSTRVDVADPIAMLSVAQQPQIAQIAAQARERLQRAIMQLGSLDSGDAQAAPPATGH